jgi:hypothetical protein
VSSKKRRDRDVDPEVFFRPSGRSRANRKDLQLCAEVQRAFALALLCDCRDPVVQDFYVEAVEPLEGGGRLGVTLRCSDPGGLTYSELVERLARFKQTARASVAARIRRKRAPELELVLVVGDGVEA